MTKQEFEKIRSRIGMANLRHRPIKTEDEKVAAVNAYMQQLEKLQLMKKHILENY